LGDLRVFGVFRSAGKTPYEGHLTVAQLLTSLVVGMGGSRILTLEVQKLILRSQRDIEEAAKENVVGATKMILFEPEDD
jgi:hypothetical protein